MTSSEQPIGLSVPAKDDASASHLPRGSSGRTEELPMALAAPYTLVYFGYDCVPVAAGAGLPTGGLLRSQIVAGFYSAGDTSANAICVTCCSRK
ncbi:hypothetical protein B2M20_04160 [Nitrobacter vulgaris]|uniref:Uncharacterized protein n=1 Tax=Nitrobacter vulgaris TaxID=29421 RepID=A0A1V4I167_NITVU|nr:hypothetical protein B2M20_04160 [Nitrobacter vulgaris]